MLKKIKIIGLSLALFASQFFISIPASAAADTCTWTGAVSATWSDGGNWTGCDNGGVPESGDALIFPESASNKSAVNDLVAYSFTTLQISGSGYTLTGTGLTLTGTTPLTINQNATIGLNITYAPSMNAFLRVSGTQTLTMNGTSTFSGVTGEVNVGTGGFSGTIDFVGNVNGDAGTQLIAVNGATAIVRGAANTFLASTVGAESNGTFECRSATCFGDNANNIYSGNGIVELHTSNTYSNDWETSAPAVGDSWLYAYASISITGNGTVNDAIGIAQQTDGESLQFTGSITNTSAISVFGSSTAAQVRFDGAVSGAGGFAFGGATTYMSDNGTYDGTNTVNAGSIVIVDMPAGLGSTVGITNVLDGASVRFSFGAETTVSEPLQIAGSGIAGEGSIVQIDESVVLSGAIALGGDATIGVDTAAIFSRFELSGVISGTGDITLLTSPTTSLGDSSIQFTGSSSNTYVGKVIAQGLRFYADKSSGIAVTGDIDVLATSTKESFISKSINETIADNSHITLTRNGSNNALLVIGTSSTETIGYVTGDGEISLGAAATLIMTHGGDYEFSGDISKFTNFPVGDSVIRKQGSGTANFTGGINDSYVSGVTPSFMSENGTLKTNSTDFALVPVVVGSGSVLRGTGNIGAAIVNSGGSINVGNSPGCLTLTSLNLNNGATFTQEIAGGTACTSYDRTTVTGTADITNATLSVLPTYTPGDGTVFTILAAGTVTGTFSGLANGSTITANGIVFRVNYTSTTVTLTKLSGTALASPNTGLGRQNSLGMITSVLAAIALILVAKRYGAKKSK